MKTIHGLMLVTVLALTGCATVYHSSDPVERDRLKTAWHACEVTAETYPCVGCGTATSALALAADFASSAAADAVFKDCMNKQGWRRVPGHVNTWEATRDHAADEQAELEAWKLRRFGPADDRSPAALGGNR